jgi:hypothetical protein
LVNWVAVEVPTNKQDDVAGDEDRFNLLRIGETNWVVMVRLANAESRFG